MVNYEADGPSPAATVLVFHSLPHVQSAVVLTRKAFRALRDKPSGPMPCLLTSLPCF